MAVWNRNFYKSFEENNECILVLPSAAADRDSPF